MKEKSIFDYIQDYWTWADGNKDKSSTGTCSMYFLILRIANTLRWKPEFGITGREVMNELNIHSYNTYKKYFDTLIEAGLILITKKSINQYHCNIISLSRALSNIDTPRENALSKNDRPREKHVIHSEDNKDLIDKEDIIAPKKKKPVKINFSESEVFDKSIFIERWQQTETGKRYPNINAERVYEHMKLSGGEYKYIDWMAAAQKWVNTNPNSPQWNNVKQPTQLLPDEFTSPAAEASARFKLQVRAAILGDAAARGKLNRHPTTD
jgi:hypothetical protein